MKYGILFIITSILLFTMALLHRSWWLVLIWPAISMAWVGLAYIRCKPAILGKQVDGTIKPVFFVGLLPFLLYTWSLWHLLRLFERKPAVHVLNEKILIGRRLLTHELPADIQHVVDLTCEFCETVKLRQQNYHACPILDASAPAATQLKQWAEQIAKLEGKVYIHCAQGHGRTGMVAAAVLLQLALHDTPDTALRFICEKRSGVRLNKLQLSVLQEAYG